MKNLSIRPSIALCLLATFAVSLQTSNLRADSDSDIVAKINEHIRQGWEDNEVTPSDKADDAEFARRAALDIVGRIPTYSELTTFLDSEAGDKRERFVDQLLDHEDYIRNSASIWGNLLVGRSNNRGGGRAALDRWLRNAIYTNIPYDQFVKELLTAEGSSDENGAVVFLSSHLNEMAVPATSITARLFLGRQLQCTQCHNHPFNDWQQAQFWGMNAFFRGTQRQGNPNRGAVTLTDSPAATMVDFEKRNGTMQSARRQFFDGDGAKVAELDVTVDILELRNRGQQRALAKPRTELADYITDPSKPFLAETQVNRVWGQLFGYGFTKPVDDMGPHNQASHPELLEYLAGQFREAGYDNKRLIRWIAASEAYNLTSRFNDANLDDNPAAGEMPIFSHMYLKQFRAEQLYDSLLIATAADQANRTSDQAEAQRATWLRQFVQTFGTDENDESTSFNGTIPQALLLMNGQLMNNALGGGNGSFLRSVVLSATGRPDDDATSAPKTVAQARLAATRAARSRNKNTPAKIETLFLVALSRKPTPTELDAFNDVYAKGNYSDPVVGLQDVFWSLLNSNEFVINH
ncbi:MAG: DUF1549 domain-containing protein [Planctomycetaceae bacterium]|nr:DUF1549 domain-containing protein [Planctomycetaceae bacterium]